MATTEDARMRPPTDMPRLSDLTLDQLNDLVRGAEEAHDHAAVAVLQAARYQVLRELPPTAAEREAMALAVACWTARCERTFGHPWMRSFADPAGRRRCPGCEACRSADITAVPHRCEQGAQP